MYFKDSSGGRPNGCLLFIVRLGEETPPSVNREMGMTKKELIKELSREMYYHYQRHPSEAIAAAMWYYERELRQKSYKELQEEYEEIA